MIIRIKNEAGDIDLIVWLVGIQRVETQGIQVNIKEWIFISWISWKVKNSIKLGVKDVSMIALDDEFRISMLGDS